MKDLLEMDLIENIHRGVPPSQSVLGQNGSIVILWFRYLGVMFEEEVHDLKWYSGRRFQ